MSCPLSAENIWVQKNLFNEAEKNYVIHLSKMSAFYKLLDGNETKSASASVTVTEKRSGNVSVKPSKSEPVVTLNNEKALPLNEAKKEKEKKNKRLNKNKDSVAAILDSANMEGSLHQGQAKPLVENSPRSTQDLEEPEKLDKEENIPNSKKSKKDRWRNRRKTNSNRDDDSSGKLNNTASNGISKGELFGDEKKVSTGTNQSTLVSEIAKARQHIKNSLERMDGIAALAAASPGGDVLQRLAALENENKNLVELTNTLKKALNETQNRVNTLENRLQSLAISSGDSKLSAKPAAASASKAVADDDVDLFGSDSEEDAAVSELREKRLAEYAAKKSKKPVLIAKSSLVLDIKPWDDETDLKLMEHEVRKITCDGLLWGASKFVPVAFGIKKLTISCVVEDEKVSIDWLTEQIEQNEDFVQSVDVAAFNKI